MPPEEHQPTSRLYSSSAVDYTPEQVEFIMAVARWKRQHAQPFPSLVDLLHILQTLGWRKVD